MINQLHALVHRPERGWDPISPEYAAWYAGCADKRHEAVSAVASWTGSLSGRSILDLGGGPGQCSVEFAKRGALVTWHDVSASYMAIAQRRARDADVQVEFSLGYLEEASRLGRGRFDVVFNQVCWCYCMSDQPFARLIYDLLRPGGTAYVETDNARASSADGRQALRRRVAGHLYERLGWKIGHPHPPRGLVASLFQKFPLLRVQVDYSLPNVERIFFTKP